MKEGISKYDMSLPLRQILQSMKTTPSNWRLKSSIF